MAIVVTPKMSARRYLKDLPGYSNLNLEGKDITEIVPEGEEYVGTYKNPDGIKDKYIHISDIALYIERNETLITLPYTNILQLKLPNNKATAQYIGLLLADGTTGYIEVAGGHDQVRDLYTFHRFLRPIIGDN